MEFDVVIQVDPGKDVADWQWIRRVIQSKVHPVEVLTVRPNYKFDECNPFINTVPIEMQPPKWIQEIIYPWFSILCLKHF